MSKRNEKISAFLDNDMHQDELMSFSLSSEANDAKVAQRYQMVGDALRGELSDASFIDVSQAVSEALANESIDVVAAERTAPKRSKASSDSNKSSIGFFGWSSLFPPLAGMATAALVAVVVVFGLSESGNDGAVSNTVAIQDTKSTSDNTTGTNASLNNVATTQPISIQKDQTQFRTVANVPAQANTLLNPANVNSAGVNNTATKMSPYINQHLEFARQDTLQGRMPYVRAVSFENKTR